MRWKSQENSIMRGEKWCRYHKTNGHSDKQCFQRTEKSETLKIGRQKKWYSLHNSTSYSNQEYFQQKSGSKCKDSSTVVDSKNSEEHETYVVDSTTVDCKSCCCNSKIAKKCNKSEVE